MKKLLLIITILLLYLTPIHAQTSESIEFEWDITEVVDGWKLYDSFISGGGYAEVATIPYVDNSTIYETSQIIYSPPNAKTRKYFIIRAYRGVKESEDSNEVWYDFDFRIIPNRVILRIKGVTTP